MDKYSEKIYLNKSSQTQEQNSQVDIFIYLLSHSYSFWIEYTERMIAVSVNEWLHFYITSKPV